MSEDKPIDHSLDDWEQDYETEPPEEDEEDQCEYGSEGCLIEDADYCIKGMTKHWWQRVLNRLSKNRQDQLENYYRAKAVEITEHCSFTCSRRPQGGTPE